MIGFDPINIYNSKVELYILIGGRFDPVSAFHFQKRHAFGWQA